MTAPAPIPARPSPADVNPPPSKGRRQRPRLALGVTPIHDGPRRIVIGCVLALLVLCVGWEIWWAPLRPGGSMLVLKALPLLVALPGLWSRRLRVYQWWSMLILLYVAEGSLRLVSDAGVGALLGGLELVLALIAFGAILWAVRGTREKATPSVTA